MESSYVKVNERPFREGTELREQKFALGFNAGGIGDYINWVTAVEYAIESAPWLSGWITTPPYFEDLCRLWLSKYAPRFEIIVTRSKNFRELPTGTQAAIPDAHQYANACGFGLFDLGFVLFNQMSWVPPGWRRLPEIRGDETPLAQFGLPEEYVVITPSATADNRRLTTEALNELVVWLKRNDITPVYLGKVEVAPDHKGVSPKYLETSGVIDLREQTNLVEAACVIARAQLTIGLDNGLLHLACCSTAPVAIAFTTAEPRLRVPPRAKGARTLVITPPESLACRFCQTSMRKVLGHDFKNCLYGDNLCVKSITGELLVGATRKVLEEI